MTRIANLVLNLSIGVKLGITSGLGVLLVVAMVLGQSRSNATMREVDARKSAQQTIARDAVDAKASIRGMQTGVRDLRLASDSAGLQKAGDYLASRLKSVEHFSDEMMQLSRSAENRARIEKIKTKAADYSREAKQIAAVRGEAIGAAAGGAEAAPRGAELNEEGGRISPGGRLPIPAGLETPAHQNAEGFQRRRGEENAPGGGGK